MWLSKGTEEIPSTAISISENTVTRWTLSNGMKIVLKHTDFDTDEVLISVQAPGGYAALPLNKQAAAMLAPQMALESNFTRGVSNMLSADEVDFDIEIMPYFRGIQGYTAPAELDEFLENINKLFSPQKISEEGFNRVVSRIREHLLQKNYDFEEEFQRNFTLLNNLNTTWLQNLSLKDLDSLDIKSSQTLFNEFFSRPEDFCVVIVGNFNVDTIQALIEKYLAIIPKRKSGLQLTPPRFAKPPHTEKEILGVGEVPH